MTNETPDYPTEAQLRPQQRNMLKALNDFQDHTVDDLRAFSGFEGYKRNTIHEIIRLLREKGYKIVSPEKKLTKPYTFRLLSMTPGEPPAPRRCGCCGQRINGLG